MTSTHSQKGQKKPERGVARRVQPMVTWGPVLLLMAVIFWLSSQSHPLGMGDRWFDEILGVGGHFTEYGLLALAWRWALTRQWPNLRHATWIALALTLLYALSDEFHQSFVPGRAPDPFDILVDMAGAVSFLGVGRVFEWGEGVRG